MPPGSVKVRRYAEAYLHHVAHGGLEPKEFKAGQGQPSFSYLRMEIGSNLERGRPVSGLPPWRPNRRLERLAVVASMSAGPPAQEKGRPIRGRLECGCLSVTAMDGS
jgi:hypothetical protein